jgi:chromosome segregation ATPase
MSELQHENPYIVHETTDLSLNFSGLFRHQESKTNTHEDLGQLKQRLARVETYYEKVVNKLDEQQRMLDKLDPKWTPNVDPKKRKTLQKSYSRAILKTKDSKKQCQENISKLKKKIESLEAHHEKQAKNKQKDKSKASLLK